MNFEMPKFSQKLTWPQDTGMSSWTRSRVFVYLHLPSGINSACEYFQKKLVEALQGLSGFVCIVDYVVIHGRDTEEHD